MIRQNATVGCEIESATTGQGTARPRRADAVRNIAAILEAATECLSRDPDVSIAEIAAAAGVGRITLYGHFKTRAELVDAVLVRTIEEADRLLDATDTRGDPRAALVRLTAASWQIVDRFRNLTVIALRELPPERMLAVHDRIMRRIESIIERGQRSGDFRTDLPAPWLVAVAINLMHLAATETAGGRVSSDEAPGLLSATLLSALSPQRSAAAGLEARGCGTLVRVQGGGEGRCPGWTSQFSGWPRAGLTTGRACGCFCATGCRVSRRRRGSRSGASSGG